MKICNFAANSANMAKETFTEEKIIKSIASLWNLLTEEEQQIMRKKFTIETYKKNEVIYYDGETPRSFLCLLRGKVKICKECSSKKNQIVRVLKPVDYFGYRAFYANEDYVTSAAAFEATTICKIPLSIIDKFINENSRLTLFFMRQLAIKLGESEQRTINLTQKHLRGRLAESLLFLKDNYGLEEDESTLSIYLSREDLANMSNMTTANAIRTLSAFASEKIIAIDGKKIKIIDEEALKKISRLG